jgi:hypothetical protein
MKWQMFGTFKALDGAMKKEEAIVLGAHWRELSIWISAELG